MKYDVTIGIPVYNADSFIQKALMSALAQSYPSIEFLIVNDCSEDASLSIIQGIKWSSLRGEDIRIVTHVKNLGVSESRNQIINEAKGDYLYFMDSDDVITESAISLLMDAICRYDAEIAFGSYERIDLSGERSVYQYPSLSLLENDGLANFAYRKYAGIQASACNYLVKTSLLREHHLRFIHANYWEDMAFTFDLVTHVSRAVLLSDITYSYICREGSLSQYQQRTVIPKDEIMRNVSVVNHLKETSSVLYNKVYYPNRCFILALTDFYIACNILKRRKEICPSVTDKEIKALMSHPASFRQICGFRQSRLKNLSLYLVGRLPSRLCVFVVRLMGKVKKLI